MTKIKAIFFDVGGVITQPPILIKVIDGFKSIASVDPKVVEQVLKKYWYMWKTDEIGENQFYESVSKELGTDPKKIEKVRHNCYKLVKTDPEILELVKKLRNYYKTAILSNHTRVWFEYLISRYKFDQLFDEVIVSYRVKKAKPNRDIFELALGKIRVKADECIFIDNQENNITAAKEFGIKTILFRNLKQLKEELSNLDVKV
jgi:epoxide hydrolase-like predicted phosphatase